MVSLVAFAAACSTAAPRPSPKEASSAAASAAAFYPLAVGNSWTYEVTSAGSSRRDTVQIVGRDGPWFLDDHRGRFRTEPDGIRDADRYLLRNPLTAGARWTAVENLVVQRFEVISTDAQLATRAGSFEGCIVVRNEQPLERGRGKYVTEWTYAPGVGLARLLTHTVSASGASHEQVKLELVAYRVR
jgi:hypothetical protein